MQERYILGVEKVCCFSSGVWHSRGPTVLTHAVGNMHVLDLRLLIGIETVCE